MKTPKWFLKKAFVAYVLMPLSIMYYLFSRAVYYFRLFYQKRSKRPVICIGNILAGGVGKTPMVMEIARRMGAPVVMRGYKKADCTENLGDEAKMLKKAGISVHVGDRKRNIDLLNAQKDAAPIVMDDGFQNPGVKKNISILVFDQSIGIGNGFLMPSGPLREPMCAVRRADAVLIIKSKSGTWDFNAAKYGAPVFYATNQTIMPKTKKKLVAFAGIGYPEKFFNSLVPKAAQTKSFPDHHMYTKVELDNLFNTAVSSGADLITTEKDWVRLPKYAQKKIKHTKLETAIEPAFWKWLKVKLHENI